MSGYGSGGWQDPYGQQYGSNPYHGQSWQDPYAAQSYGYGYGPPGMPPSGGSNGAAIAALVCNIISAVLCCAGIGWLPGIILGAMAISRAQTDPESARQLTLWSWVCFVLNLVIVAAILVVFGVIGASSHGTSL